MKNISKHILSLGAVVLSAGILQAAADTPSTTPQQEQATDPAASVNRLQSIFDDMKTCLNSIRDRQTADAAAIRLNDIKTTLTSVLTALGQASLSPDLNRRTLDTHSNIGRLLMQHKALLQGHDFYGSDNLRKTIESYFIPMKKNEEGAYVIQ